MKIKNKVILSFVGLIVTFSLLSLFLIQQLKHQGEQTVLAFNQPLKAIDSSHAAWETFLSLEIYTDKILAMTEPADAAEVQRKVEAYRQGFNQQIQSAVDNSLEEKAKLQALDIKQLANRWITQINQHVAGINQTQLLDRRILATEKKNLEHKLKELVAETLRESNHLAEQVEHDIESKLTTVISVLMFIAIIAIVVAVVITNSIINPIQRLTDAVVELTRGDGDLTRRLDESANNEMGCLSREFNLFIAKVHKSVAEIANSVDVMHQQFGEFASITEQTKQGTLTQTQQINQISQAMDSVTSSVVTVSESVVVAKEQAQNILQGTQSSSQLVAQATQELNVLTENVDKTSEVIFSLSESSEAIGKVLEVIESIADQTNLLALNAAIEAARAGEAGRGFSVVADEVRSLALKTQESTTDIHHTIKLIQEQAEQAKQMMEVGRNGTQNCVANNDELSHSLSDVLNCVNNIQQTSEVITKQSEQQVEISDGVADNLSNIVVIAEQTAQGTETLQQSNVKLLNSIDNVSKMVNQFKLS